jgi:hypothetical protein
LAYPVQVLAAVFSFDLVVCFSFYIFYLQQKFTSLNFLYTFLHRGVNAIYIGQKSSCQNNVMPSTMCIYRMKVYKYLFHTRVASGCHIKVDQVSQSAGFGMIFCNQTQRNKMEMVTRMTVSVCVCIYIYISIYILNFQACVIPMWKFIYCRKRNSQQ